MAASKYDIELDVSHPSNTSHWHVADLVGSAKRVLDVGCSTGYLAEALAGRGNEVLGVEYDDASAELARSRGLQVLTADLESVDLSEHFGPASFDAVVYADVLEHLRDPLPVLRATLQLLRPAGFVVISLPNIAHGDVRLALLDGRFDYSATGILDNTHTKFFTRSSLRRFVHDAGFAVAEMRRTSVGLFGTELGLDPEDFDSGIVERVLADPESTTYQFVVKAVRDDAAAAGVEHAERLYEAQVESDRLAAEVARLSEASGRLQAEAAHLREGVRLAEQAASESNTLQEELRALGEEQQRRARAEIERLRAQRRQFRQERDALRAQLGQAPSPDESG